MAGVLQIASRDLNSLKEGAHMMSWTRCKSRSAMVSSWWSSQVWWWDSRCHQWRCRCDGVTGCKDWGFGPEDNSVIWTFLRRFQWLEPCNASVAAVGIPLQTSWGLGYGRWLCRDVLQESWIRTCVLSWTFWLGKWRLRSSEICYFPHLRVQMVSLALQLQYDLATASPPCPPWSLATSCPGLLKHEGRLRLHGLGIINRPLALDPPVCPGDDFFNKIFRSVEPCRDFSTTAQSAYHGVHKQWFSVWTPPMFVLASSSKAEFGVLHEPDENHTSAGGNHDWASSFFPCTSTLNFFWSQMLKEGWRAKDPDVKLRLSGWSILSRSSVAFWRTILMVICFQSIPCAVLASLDQSWHYQKAFASFQFQRWSLHKEHWWTCGFRVSTAKPWEFLATASPHHMPWWESPMPCASWEMMWVVRRRRILSSRPWQGDSLHTTCALTRNGMVGFWPKTMMPVCRRCECMLRTRWHWRHPWTAEAFSQSDVFIWEATRLLFGDSMPNEMAFLPGGKMDHKIALPEHMQVTDEAVCLFALLIPGYQRTNLLRLRTMEVWPAFWHGLELSSWEGMRAWLFGMLSQHWITIVDSNVHIWLDVWVSDIRCRCCAQMWQCAKTSKHPQMTCNCWISSLLKSMTWTYNFQQDLKFCVTFVPC